MKTITKALVGTVAAGAMATASASPAFARDHDGGISAGDVIAGALIIGGIAAVAAAVDHDNDRYSDGFQHDSYDYGRGGYGNGYGYQYGNGYGYYNAGNSRQAVEQCVNAAERSASRYSYGGRADVTDVRSITRLRDGFTVRGRIAVNTMGRNWRAGDRSYGRGWNGDYRGANTRLRGYDSGSFTCRVSYGRVAGLDFSDIRGL